MDDSALKQGFFGVNEKELKITQVPEMITDSGEYELTLLRRYLGNDSSVVVGDVLDSTRGLVDQYSAIALEALAALGNFPSGSIPGSNIELDSPTAPGIGDISVIKPGKPDYMQPEVGTAPSLRGEIQDIVMQPVGKPLYSDPDAPNDTLAWTEDPYISELLGTLQNSLSDIILNGGTGLSSEYEDALWNRARSRLQLAHEEKYQEAERYFSSKGHVAPPGALVARLNLLNREKFDQEALISSDIAVKQLEIGHEHKKFCQDLAQRTEAMTIQQRGDVMARALDAAKSSITMLYDLYKTQLEGIRNKIDIYRTEVEAEATRVGAITAANKSLTDTLSAEVKAWSERVNAEFSLVEAVIKMYVAELGGYESEVRAEAVKLQALVDRYKAQIDSVNVQGQISLGEYEQLVKAMLGDIELKLGSQKEASRIAAQVAASALSAFNASASISDNSSQSRGYNESKSMSMSNAFSQSLSNSLGVSHSKGQSASDSYNESKSFNYSESN